MTVTLADIAAGTQKTVEFQSPVLCTRCDGNGSEPGTFPTRCAMYSSSLATSRRFETAE